MQRSERNYKKVVVKIGSSLLCRDNSLDSSFIQDIARQVSHLSKEGSQIVLVSSGAIACGMFLLGLGARPKDLSVLQAAAAIGQHELMHLWRSAFKESGLICAQLLLTWEDFSSRKRYLNAKNTLNTLLEFRSIPVINENDTVSTEEIKFGDNDRLSALVAVLVGADLLIMLSDVDGLLDREKNVVRIVDEITPDLRGLACPTDKKQCVGGMVTKIDAAKIAMDSGISCLISNGRTKDIILSATNTPESFGTLFCPKKKCLAAKKRWIAFSSKPKGAIIVDDGARQALGAKKSLLSVGVVGVEGEFNAGDIVQITDKQHAEFARGRVGVSSRQLSKIKGSRYHKEIIHCDNIVIF